MTRHKVFVSYSRRDAESLQAMLPALQAVPRIAECLWYDTQDIDTGEKFHRHILEALESARIGILLLSNWFLTSPYIRQYELPYLLREAERQTLRLACVYLTKIAPAALQVTIDLDGQQRVVALNGYRGINDPSTPLVGCTPAKRDEVFAELADRVARQLASPVAQTRPPADELFELAIALREQRGTWEHRFSLPQDPDFSRPDLDCPSPAMLLHDPPDLVLGDELFEVLFGRDVQTSQAILGAAFGGMQRADPTSHQLRIHLRTDDARLHALPWHKIAYRDTPLAEGGWTVELHAAGDRMFPVIAPHLCTFPGKVVLSSAHDGGPQAAAHSRDVQAWFQHTWPKAQAPMLAPTPHALQAALGTGSPRLFYYYGPATREGLRLDSDTDCVPWSVLAELLQQARSVSLVLLNLLGENSTEAISPAQQLLVGAKAVLLQCNPRVHAHQAAHAAQQWLQHVLADSTRLDPVRALHQYGHGHIAAWTSYASWRTIAPRQLTMPDLINLLLDRWTQRAVVLQAKEEFMTYAKARRIYHTVALGKAGCRVSEFPETASQHLRHTQREREVILYHKFSIPTLSSQIDDVVQQSLRLSARQTVLQALLTSDYRPGRAPWFLVLGWIVETPWRTVADMAAILRNIATWCRTRLLPELFSLGQDAPVRVLSVVAVETPTDEATTALEGEIAACIEEMNDAATFHWGEMERLGRVRGQDLTKYFQDADLCTCDDRDRGAFPGLLLAGRPDMPFDEAVATLRRGTPDNWGNLLEELRSMREASTWPPKEGTHHFWEAWDGR